MREPNITINGHTLTDAQAMTVRVALQELLLDMRYRGALGNDEHGEAMRTGYVQRAQEINIMMAGQPR